MEPTTRKVLGVTACNKAGKLWEFELDGEDYTWHGRSKVLSLKDGVSIHPIGTFPRLCVAIGFAVGAHDGMGLADRTMWLKCMKDAF